MGLGQQVNGTRLPTGGGATGGMRGYGLQDSGPTMGFPRGTWEPVLDSKRRF
jgi:hypothetical protein